MAKQNQPIPPVSSSSEKGKKAESKYDANVLRKLVKEGKTAKEIMTQMGIGHKQILKHHLMKLCATDKAFYEVPGLYDKNSRKAYVNARGEIKIKNALVDFGNLKLEPDKTEFSVSVEGNSIILTIITADGKETDNSSESYPMQTEGEA